MSEAQGRVQHILYPIMIQWFTLDKYVEWHVHPEEARGSFVEILLQMTKYKTNILWFGYMGQMLVVY